jgi:hypothetical protein
MAPFGTWHGDFGPWNAAWGVELEVWDWERFDPDVPVGLDAAHWRAQLAVGTDPTAAWQLMRGDVEELLDAASDPASDPASAGGDERPDGALAAACYLLAIWSRYRHDAEVSPTPALRARVTWLCAVAEAAVTALGKAQR